jgi:hypothetical protein
VRALDEVASSELVWIQSHGLNFELRAGDEIVGSLRWERYAHATAETAAQQWNFNREGFWRTRITVRAPGAETNFAVFYPRWLGGGTLEGQPGRPLRMVSRSWWRAQWDWVDEVGQPLVHIKNQGKWFEVKYRVVIEQQAVALPEMPLLVMLGLYVIVLRSMDAGSGGA